MSFEQLYICWAGISLTASRGTYNYKQSTLQTSVIIADAWGLMFPFSKIYLLNLLLKVAKKHYVKAWKVFMSLSLDERSCFLKCLIWVFITHFFLIKANHKSSINAQK